MNDVTLAHIIRNDEAALTECGLVLAGAAASDDTTPQALAFGADVALWDNADTPSGADICPDCFATYSSPERLNP